MSELVSVIVPIYNVEAYLDKCVETICDQTYKKLEIILVDDGSPDRCPELCDEWEKRDSRIHVVHKKNGGLSDARNVGIDVSHGDYIMFVDSDDWIEIDMVENLLNEIKTNRADICACGIVYEYPGKSRIREVVSFKGSSTDALRHLYNNTNYPVAAWNKIYRRKCWDTLRFPLQKLCEDAFTTYQLIDRAEAIVQVPKAFYHYRIRANSIMTSKFRHKMMDEEEAWRKNYEFMMIHYPEHKKASYDFYLQRVDHLINTMDESARIKYKEDYTLLKQILKKNALYILFSSQISMKQRLKLFSNCMRLMVSR